MERSFIICILIYLSLGATSQNVPYNQSPDWISNPSGHIATGLGLADINGDGWKDLVVANGNDIQRQRLVVYYNGGDGSFPQDPDWQSDDIDYHGHLACGDIDQDGDVDVAVSVYIGASGFGSPGKIKVYYNQGGELEATPSFVSNPFYTFSCALGDADGDGDLDLAATAGEPYNDILDHGKIFINTNGTFQEDAQWQSEMVMGSLDVEFGDINRDGFMDVIFVCENTDNYIFPGSASGISTTAAWQSAEAESFINSVDIGYRGENEALVVMTENSQLGGDGKVRRYLFSDPLPASSAADWYSNPFGYGSGIALADVDLDSTLDLVYGGWWLPVKVALGGQNGFQLTPSYTSSTASVVEAIQMADLGMEAISSETKVLTMEAADMGKHVLILPDQLVEKIVNITRNGIVLTTEEFTYVPNKPWISFEQEFVTGEVIEVLYQTSPHPDMVITNWDSSKGNYIFYNTNPPVGLPDNMAGDHTIELFPNPADGFIHLHMEGDIPVGQSVRITDISARVYLDAKPEWVNGHSEIDISNLPEGLYILNINRFAINFIKKR